MESERSVQLMTPLNARIYLEAYYNLSDPNNSQRLTPLLNQLSAWDVIPVATLRDTWPCGEWEEPESDQAGTDEAIVPELEKLRTPDTSMSLRDRAMATVLQTLLDKPDESTSLLAEGELLTDFLPKLKAKLYKQSNTLKPSPHILDLLYSTLEEDTDVDLSPFKSFSAEDLSLVVSRLRKHGKMRTLCISNRPDLTAKDLQVVLRDAAGLKALYVLEDPQIPSQGLSPLLKDCDIYDSDLLRQAIEPEPVRSRSDPSSSVVDVAGPVGQVCGDNDITQLVWIGVSERQALNKNHRLESGLIDWETLQEEKDRTCTRWYSPGLRYKRYPLDIPLSIFRTVAGLLCLFKWSSASELIGDEWFGKGAAFSFAMASSIHGAKELAIGPAGVGSGLGMCPLAAGLYRDSIDELGPLEHAHEHLEPGRWAIVLIHEAYNAGSQKSLDLCQHDVPAGADSHSEDDNPKIQGLPFRAIKRLRYVLVTPCTEPQASGRDFIVADIPAYLEHTIGKIGDKGKDGDLKIMVDAYNSRIAAMDTVGFYEDEDIHDILPKVFPKQKAASSSSKTE